MAKTYKFPRVPLPRQTEKAHSAAQKPLPSWSVFDDWQGSDLVDWDDPATSRPQFIDYWDPRVGGNPFVSAEDE